MPSRTPHNGTVISRREAAQRLDIPLEMATRHGIPTRITEQELEAHQIAAEMQAVREQLSQVPAAVVIANHAMGCYELAAIHLSNQPPRLAEAQLAIDAFSALLGAISGRLGEDEATLQDALAQIRLAFVQIKASWEGGATEAPVSPTTTEEDGGD